MIESSPVQTGPAHFLFIYFFIFLFLFFLQGSSIKRQILRSTYVNFEMIRYMYLHYFFHIVVDGMYMLS